MVSTDPLPGPAPREQPAARGSGPAHRGPAALLPAGGALRHRDAGRAPPAEVRGPGGRGIEGRGWGGIGISC